MGQKSDWSNTSVVAGDILLRVNGGTLKGNVGATTTSTTYTPAANVLYYARIRYHNPNCVFELYNASTGVLLWSDTVVSDLSAVSFVGHQFGANATDFRAALTTILAIQRMTYTIKD